jgi:UDP-glucose 4-epimerase
MGGPQRSRVLVTGGAGFIGRRLVRALAARGSDVIVADKRPFPGDPGGNGAGSVTQVLGDLRDPDVVAEALPAGTDTVVHLAAVTSVLLSVEDPAGTYDVNVAVTQRLLERAREQGTRAFLLASTNAVTGDVGREVISERLPLRPLTPYGATKAAGEMLLSCYTAAYGLTGCALRFSNVYGPGMEAKDSFIPRLMRAARDGTGVQIRGDGNMLRDVVHVDDVVAGVLAAWEARHTGSVILGSGSSVSVNDMVESARRVTGRPIPAEHIPAGSGEMPAVIVDISAARALGYQPRYELDAGLATVWPEFSPDGGSSAGGPASALTAEAAR